MEFFNRKEEVLDVELTQYGKYLLSIGKFKPSYYAFFDDDIIYDIRYQGLAPNNLIIEGSPVENQKDAQKRIQETPRVKVQHNFITVDKTHKQVEDKPKKSAAKILGGGGSGTNSSVVGAGGEFGGYGGKTLGTSNVVDQLEEAMKESGIDFSDATVIDVVNSDGKVAIADIFSSDFIPSFPYPEVLKNDYFGTSLPLGTSDYNSIYSPAWQINFLQGQLKDSINHAGGDGDRKFGIKKIPQLEVEVTFNTSVGHNTSVDLDANVVSEATPGSLIEGTNNHIYPNGRFIKIEEDYILLDIQEINSLIGSEGFELEVFEILYENSLEIHGEYLHRKFFINSATANLTGFPYGTEISGMADAFSNDLVEYYFEVSVDDEIEQVFQSNQIETKTYLNDLEPCEDDV